MVFDEFKATEIIEKFGLPKAKLAIWRSRNAIPNKYFNEGYSPVNELLKSFKIIDFSFILSLINSKKIKLSVINNECGFSSNKVQRAIKRQTKLTYNDYMALIYEGNNLKKITQQAIQALLDRDKDTLMDFFNHKAIHILAICNGNISLANKIKTIRYYPKTPFPFEYAFELDKYLNILLLELKFIIVYLHFRAEFDTIHVHKYSKQ
ncbi:MAG: hypothetical protein WCZ21_03305 [Bacteroidales bacterium]|jgi:hypothetical protein